MDLRAWPQLEELVAIAAHAEGLQVWLFGSALRISEPADLDVLLVYECREDVVSLRRHRAWEAFDPPCHIIAMTPLEVEEYEFISTTGALRLV